LTSTLHTDPRSLERAGFLLIIANIAHKRKMYECAYIYIYIYRYTIYVSHLVPLTKARAPAFSSARVYIFRGKIFRNYPSLLYHVRPYVQPQKPKIKLGLARRSGTHASEGREKEVISVRGCSPQRTRVYVFRVYFLIEPFCFTFLSFSLSFALANSPSDKPLRRRRDGSEKIFSREKGTSIRQPVGFLPTRVSSRFKS